MIPAIPFLAIAVPRAATIVSCVAELIPENADAANTNVVTPIKKTTEAIRMTKKIEQAMKNEKMPR